MEQKNKFSVGETVEIMKPDGRNMETVVRGIYDSQETPRRRRRIRGRNCMWSFSEAGAL